MGAIYLTIDTLLFDRQVAVKEMLTPVADPDELARARKMFEQEARLLATLRHGNLPAIFDYFSERNRQYLVMEFISGKTLQQTLDEAPGFLAEDQVIPWIIQVGEALTYLHSQTPPIIFRDLKPRNIMLDRGGVIKLIDFGIARIFATGKIKDTATLGTPGYAPPEQYGNAQTDVRSDVYALGVTLHQLLTKHDPSATPFNLPRGRTINPSISHGTDEVIAKATKPNPEERFQTVAEMVDALRSQTTKLLAPPSPKEPPVLPSPMKGVSALPRSWVISLPARLDEITNSLLYESRGVIVDNIVAISKQRTKTTGTTIMLRGIEGFGGTSIATRVKEDILSSSERTTTLVATVNLSDPTSLAGSTGTVKEILVALRRGSEPIDCELRQAVENAYRQQIEAGQPVTTEIEIQRYTSRSPFSVSLEVVTPLGRASLGSKFADETRVTEREIHTPPDAQQLAVRLLDTLRDLVDYLVFKDVHVILIFDKVKDIGVLNPLVPIVSRGGVYSIVIANVDDHVAWREQTPDLLGWFSKIDFYVPCLWDMPRQICRALTTGLPEADSQELYLLQKYLEYRGRGVPDRTIKAIVDTQFYSPPKKSPGFAGRLKRLLRLEAERPPRILISETQWREVIRCADLQRRLEIGWPDIFGDPQQRELSLDILTEETADRARMAIYTLADWLLEQAEQGTKVSKRAATNYALTECNLPFDERMSKVVVTRFIDFLIRQDKATSTSRGLDLTGLLTTSLLDN